MPVDTRKAPRRQVEYRSLADLRADLDRVQRAHDAGTLRVSGNWSPGQILEHLAILFRCALDGFPAGQSPPAWMRWIATALFKKGAVAGKSPPPGFKIPQGALFLRPRDSVAFEDGMAQLRAAIGRIESGERMTHPSPLFGALTHEEWVNLQLGHCRLHMSFLDLA